MTHMKLAVSYANVGNHPAAWMHPDTDIGAVTSYELFVKLSQAAERAKIDMVFRADSPASRTGDINAVSKDPNFVADVEPITLMSAVAACTRNIGLAATASTSFYEPFNIARLMASLDHISDGRAAWNVVTTSSPAAAANFGQTEQMSHDVRYERAEELLEVSLGLWNSWDTDAFVRDRTIGRYFDPAKRHELNHAGKHFSVKGPLNFPRCPQGRPVIIHARASPAGMELAAKIADCVFAISPNVEHARDYYVKLKRLLTKYGRAPEDLKVLCALDTYVGHTDEEAQKLYDDLQFLMNADVGASLLEVDLGVNLRSLPLDEPIPPELIPETSNRTTSFHKTLREIIGSRKLTFRQVYSLSGASRGGLNPAIGSPDTIADRMQEWFETGAADGFLVCPSHYPVGATDFFDLVVPILQKRGLFRTEYEGKYLYQNLGLKKLDTERSRADGFRAEPAMARSFPPRLQD